ncbi:hypothetical protein [Verrucomicrobium spinosum]|uniref:hypothetical protein n=1 Tax=Verrucomicrobium spinosum TaxID=2736 RepID=UPI000946551A|nr:hypothetical protein [Verrucomicrobium spinosum]
MHRRDGEGEWAADRALDRRATALERAALYLSKMPVAVAGQSGHATTFRAASALVWGFDLEPEEALPLLQQWNQAASRRGRSAICATSCAVPSPRRTRVGSGGTCSTRSASASLIVIGPAALARGKASLSSLLEREERAERRRRREGREKVWVKPYGGVRGNITTNPGGVRRSRR